jgi:hypothetical protein
LPRSYEDTVPLPEGDTVFIPGVLITDTLLLRDGGQSTRHTRLEDGPVTTDLLWSSDGPGDSITVTEVFPAGSVPHYGVLDGDVLQLRIASLVRPGVYLYARVP